MTEKRVGRIACARRNQPYVVPFHFVFDGGEHIYSFSNFGQKIEWMRTNSLVCVEVDNIKNQFEWTSFVIFGRFEELTETPEFEENRLLTYQLLSQYPMWWQPAYVTGTHQTSESEDDKPIYFRIVGRENNRTPRRIGRKNRTSLKHFAEMKRRCQRYKL